MANEAVIVELLGDRGNVIDFTVASGTAITKGTILQLTDPRTGSASSSTNEVFAGIAATDKAVSSADASTSLGAYTKGIFDLKSADDTIAVGALVSLSGANLIKTATATDVENGYIVGKALEAATAAEVIEVAVGVY